MHPIVKAIFDGEKDQNKDVPNLKWKLISKYFEADLQFGVVEADISIDAEDFIEQNIR